jgi:transposase-like protein
MTGTATVTVQLLEARQGKPLREILVALYREHGSIAKVARALGVTRQTLWLWMKLIDMTAHDLRLEAGK